MLRLKLKLAASLIIIALLVVFTLQNMTMVTVTFVIGGPVLIPLAYLLYAAILFGMMLVGIAFLTRMFRLKSMQKKVSAQQEALRQISQSLITQQVGKLDMPRPALLPQSQSPVPQFASVKKPMGNTPAQGLVSNTSPNARKINAQKVKGGYG